MFLKKDLFCGLDCSQKTTKRTLKTALLNVLSVLKVPMHWENDRQIPKEAFKQKDRNPLKRLSKRLFKALARPPDQLKLRPAKKKIP